MKILIQTLKVQILLALVFGTSILTAYDLDAFVIKVQTDNPGVSGSSSFTIPTNSNYTYNYDVDCDNDGEYEHLAEEGNVTCNYSPRTISIRGTFPAIYFHNEGDKEKIISIEHWGNIQWKSMAYAFEGASNLEVNAIDTPNLSRPYITLSSMFAGASSFNQDIGNWDVSNVSDFGLMFARASSFNQDISDWNLSRASTTYAMFSQAASFNQDIGNWDVSNIVVMQAMFSGASSFNQDISQWDVSNVVYMTSMFSNTSAFNQDISDWDVSNVTSMFGMFTNASAFNQDISDWDVSLVESMTNLFLYTDMTVSNYDSLLLSWNKLELKNDLTFDAGSSKFCQGESAKTQIISTDNWTILDSGENCTFYITTPKEQTVESGTTRVALLTAVHDEDFAYGVLDEIADGDKFEFDDSGVLHFKIAPDVNNPTDKNGDNIYKVQVIIQGPSKEDYKTFKVTVEPNNTTLSPIIMYLLN